jgi:hypothetical protein
MKASLNKLGRVLVGGVFAVSLLGTGSAALAHPYGGYAGDGDYGGYGGDYGRTEYRCTNGSDDHCAYFRCDRGGDDCHRVSGWTSHSRYNSRGWRDQRGDAACDRDGDDCRTGGRWNGGYGAYSGRYGW